MNGRAAIFVCLVLPAFTAHAQDESEPEIPEAHYPDLPKTGKTANDFVPKGWNLEIEKKEI